jgi:hypothetical protein
MRKDFRLDSNFPQSNLSQFPFFLDDEDNGRQAEKK